MKNEKILPFLILLAILLQGFRFERYSDKVASIGAGSNRFSIVYIEGTSPGLSIKVRNHLESNVDSITANPFLLYVSNSMVSENRKSEYYTKSKTSVQKRLNKLDDETLPLPDLLKDKRFIWDAIANENFSEFSQVDLHYYFTKSYLKDYILKESASFNLLNFLPVEIATLASNALVTVNIYISDDDAEIINEVKKSLDQKVMFKNDGRFEMKNLKCNIVAL